MAGSSTAGRCVGERPLPRLQQDIIAELAAAEGPRTSAILASLSDHPDYKARRSAVNRTLNALERKGYARWEDKFPHDGDWEGYEWFITDSGREARAELEAARTAASEYEETGRCRDIHGTEIKVGNTMSVVIIDVAGGGAIKLGPGERDGFDKLYLAAETRAEAWNAAQRDQESRLAAADAVFKAEALKAELDAAKDYLRLLKDDWDTCRSIGATQRAERNAIEGIGT